MKKDRKKIISMITGIILVTLFTIGTYLLVLEKNKNKENKKDTNKIVVKEFTDYENIYGKYINSDYDDIYFELKKDNKADVVVSTCSDGVFPKQTIDYKIKVVNNKVILTLKADDESVDAEYTAYKNNDGSYYFKSNLYGCTEDENTIFSKDLKNN